MAFNGMAKEPIRLDSGLIADAIAPVIISASRATDIPAFFAKWFSSRFKDGYVRWVNPFNAHQVQHVSFKRTRVIVFWTKNPKPLLPFLSQLDDAGINYYFQFTVNDYEREGLEPNVPSLSGRIETFKQLADRIGPERVIWRYDPLILSETLTLAELLNRMESLAYQLHGFTRKLVFSFADIEMYAKVRNNLAHQKQEYREFTTDQMRLFAERLVELNRGWGLELATCAELLDLSHYGIQHNRCIDDKLMLEHFKSDKELMSFLGYEPDQFNLFDRNVQSNLKDKGQRKKCGCIISKDIGAYNTCHHLCAYCYANASPVAVKNNLKKHDTKSDSIIS
ncbi:MAG: DUF1848 domain-containing protein [Desulfobulbaceae bacterium]|nr:DUF1848 domain-containing protein [Desulfobulbaceae bacterium]